MKPRIKPRNPLVAPARFRKAGSHEKPFKTQRRADKVALAKQDHRDLEHKSSKHESLPNPLSTGGSVAVRDHIRTLFVRRQHANHDHQTIHRNIPDLFQQYRCGGVKRTIIPVS